MGKIYLLSPFHDLLDDVRMGIGELDLTGQIVGVSQLKENQVFISEIVLDPFSLRSDDEFTQGKVLKNTRWSV